MAGRTRDRGTVAAAQIATGAVAGAGLLLAILWGVAASVDGARDARMLRQIADDGVVASLPLADGMRPTPIAVVGRDGERRLLSITVQDARRHRDDLLPSSLGRAEIAGYSPPSPMRDAFVRDLVERVSADLDCATGALVARRWEIARGLSDRPTYVGPPATGNAGLPKAIDRPRAMLVCDLPTTRG